MAVDRQKVLYLDKYEIHRVKLPKVINTDISFEMMFGAYTTRVKQDMRPIRDTVAISKISISNES